MDKSDKYWSCSDKESLCLRGDSNLLFARTYLLLLTLLTFCVYSDITVGLHYTRQHIWTEIYFVIYLAHGSLKLKYY